MLPVPRALREDPEGEPAGVGGVLRGAQLEHHGPPAQDGSAQPDVEPVADHREAADVEAVVLPRDREERCEVRVGAQQVHQALRPRRPDQRRAAPVAGDPHRLGAAVDAQLHREPHDDEPVRVAPQLAEPADDLPVVVDRFRTAAHECVRPHRPQPAPAAGDPLQVALPAGRSGQLHEIGQPEAALPTGAAGVGVGSRTRRSIVAVSSPATHRCSPSTRTAVRLSWLPPRTDIAGEPHGNASGDIHAVFLPVAGAAGAAPRARVSRAEPIRVGFQQEIGEPVPAAPGLKETWTWSRWFAVGLPRSSMARKPLPVSMR